MSCDPTVYPTWLRPVVAVCCLWSVLALGLMLGGCGREVTPPPPTSVAAAVTQTSATCRECHADQYAAWQGTDHALANRPVDRLRDAEALEGLAAHDPDAKPEFILGHKPLWQPLIPAPGGRWQPHEMAYDPARKEWFNVFDDGRRAGEWGHWTGRGMNWNSMCAHCHMTGYQRGYDQTTDSYRSTWVEHGVGCIQCHGPTAPGHGQASASRTASPPPPFSGDRGKMMQTCAPCHARNEALTDRFQPGDSYHDHYRVVLPVEAGTYYPDGQQRDEVFNWTSMLLSRMGHAGVTCMDCHDAHTTKTILPVTDNQLCLQCHSPPGRTLAGGVIATPIDPVTHSGHQHGSAGNSCVACHMPTTNYMQRAPRHDHAWLSPDPLMTKELGIPNACSRCHEDKGLDWNIAKAAEMFGTKVRDRQRARARAVAAAQAGSPEAVRVLLELMQAEDIPAWRATYLSLLGQLGGNETSHAVARRSLRAADPLERSAAVRLLAGAPDAADVLMPLLDDPVRLVRLDAAWILSPRLPADSPARKELDAYLALALDQPMGHLRLGQDRANRGDLAGAEKDMARAVEWDPFSPGPRDARGMVLAALGRSDEAGRELQRAAELAGARGALSAFRAGLAFAEGNRFAEAENSFRFAVDCDPGFTRAWYNLGLLLAQQNRLVEATEALRRAAQSAPGGGDYAYALATVLLRAGDRAGAREAAEQALRADPTHAGARQIIRSLAPR